MRLISAVSKTHAKSAQCLFFGVESLRYLAAQTRAARKTRCLVHGIPGIKLVVRCTTRDQKILTLSHRRELELEAVEVYEGDKECTHLGFRDLDEMVYELVEGTPHRMVEDVCLESGRRRGLLPEGPLDWSDRRRREGSSLGSFVRDANDVLGGLDEKANDFEADLAVDELDEGGVMLGDVDERIWVSTRVGCVEVGLESLWSKTGRVQGKNMHRGGKALNRHGRRRL
jgi:hypothetical protein